HSYWQAVYTACRLFVRHGMQKHMRQQFEQFQHGLVSAFEQSAKLAGPMLRTNEVMVDGFSQLLKDQAEFGQSCMAIGHRQMTAFMRASGPAALRASRDAASDYYAAASKYGKPCAAMPYKRTTD